jgi:hypothetical protein
MGRQNLDVYNGWKGNETQVKEEYEKNKKEAERLF